ncbi:MAG: hypothetical protein WDO12_00365 [Pseudomonadota bacterium]
MRNIYARHVLSSAVLGAAQYKPQPDSSDYKLEQSDSLPILVSPGFKLSF